MVRANIPLKSRYLRFRDAFKTATDLDFLVITTVVIKKATRQSKVDEVPPYMGGAVKVKTDTMPKIAD
jgi:hypothetical protein